jgi:hypothetical protein
MSLRLISLPPLAAFASLGIARAILRKTLGRALLASLCVIAASPAAAGVQSQRIWIELVRASAVEGGGFRLVQIIGNTSDRPLWLSVSQGECAKAGKIEAKQNATFSCDVPNLKPGKVPVVITVFADEARTETLETHRDEMRFSISDIRKILALATAEPASEVAFESVAFDNIAFSEKLGVGSALRGFLDYAKGTLAISSSTIQYAGGKRTVTIPVSSVRDVRLWSAGETEWVIVSYEESGEMKRAGFLAVRHRDDIPRILRAISTAALNAIDPVAGETLGDRGLQRDTRMTILEFEKVAEPGCTAAKIVDTKIEERPSNGNWSERWLVDRCGTQVAYGVKYIADPKGGTMIGITRP